MRITYTADFNRQNSVTLPSIPGVTLSTDRSETAPSQPMICRPMGPVKGAALKAQARQRIEMVRRAIREVMEGEE